MSVLSLQGDVVELFSFTIIISASLFMTHSHSHWQFASLLCTTCVVCALRCRVFDQYMQTLRQCRAHSEAAGFTINNTFSTGKIHSVRIMGITIASTVRQQLHCKANSNTDSLKTSVLRTTTLAIKYGQAVQRLCSIYQHCHKTQQCHNPEKNKGPETLGVDVHAKHAMAAGPDVRLHILVSVVSWLEGASDWNIDVLGLVWCQLGQLSSQLGQVKSCNLLIQMLGQYVHLVLVAARLALIPQLQLGNDLHPFIKNKSKSTTSRYNTGLGVAECDSNAALHTRAADRQVLRTDCSKHGQDVSMLISQRTRDDVCVLLG